MQLSRTEKSKAEKKAHRERGGRVWMFLNLLLIILIAALLVYYFVLQEPQAEEGPAYPATGMTEDGADDHGASSHEASSDEEPPPELPPEGEGNPPLTDEPDASSEGNENIEEPDSPRSVVMSFAGDTLFSGKVEGMLQEHGYDYPYRYLGTTFLDDDLTVLNLETPVTVRGVPANKRYVFKSSPEALGPMREAGVDAVNLANNHILDQGVDGLLDTLQHLQEYGIDYVGAGKNAQEAYSARYFELNGMTVALLGFSRVLPETSWYALDDRPGVAGAYDHVLPQVVEAIGEARERADLVVVMAHWGEELKFRPNDNQLMLARAFIDAGADLCIGGHPHVLQGLERYNGKWIAYSTGNFIFTKSTNPDTWKTAVFQATCTDKGDCDMKLIPYRTEVGQVIPLEGDEALALLQEVQERSIGGIQIKPSGEAVPGP
ncbi:MULTISPECIES: CapA family protein [Paenibacillus]|uniref:CapA family protein n=1 Tax=Paenibacillus campinasensis TaxID=66347 RepID=A0A268F0N9_9BACL|nr:MULTISPECIES: CapA family protein [Paenibacillus]MUG65578.1 CapA family protein [Paenibacillus campinasensis]PAD78894.1 poly-gamma-glutamate biosynthesis protein [Paenibacillus campinasensis]PAK53870.1 poly-gamma-glutamate biosynthesis protein [Paenibacillus sp. 7541]